MKYDVIIIRGGSARMMSAGITGELEFRVLLIKKNRNLNISDIN